MYYSEEDRHMDSSSGEPKRLKFIDCCGHPRFSHIEAMSLFYDGPYKNIVIYLYTHGFRVEVVFDRETLVYERWNPEYLESMLSWADSVHSPDILESFFDFYAWSTELECTQPNTLRRFLHHQATQYNTLDGVGIKNIEQSTNHAFRYTRYYVQYNNPYLGEIEFTLPDSPDDLRIGSARWEREANRTRERLLIKCRDHVLRCFIGGNLLPVMEF